MMTRFFRHALLVVLSMAAIGRAAATRPLIFPLPQELEVTPAMLALDDTVRVLVPLEPSEHDVFVAREIIAELSTRFGVAAQLERVARLPDRGRLIVMGRGDNPLVRQLCSARNVAVDASKPGPEGYVLQVDERIALVAGSDDQGTFYGMQSLRQLMTKEVGHPVVRGARVRDWPHKPYRGIRLYLPGPENLAFFKRFVREFMALNKYNQLIFEMNANMRFDRHPELNAGSLDLANSLTSTRRNRAFGPIGEEQDSVHHDNADGAILEKRDVAELVRFAREYHVDVVPEIGSLSHCYYLLTRHRELAEISEAEWPDAYCPSNPASRALLFDVLQEYIEVMQPRRIHIGHDEWRVRLGVCPRCRGKDTRELYAADVTAIHDWLAGKGVGTILWGDHLIERLRGKGALDVKTPDGTAYQRPGGLSAEMVKARIPKDILVANWMWQEPHPGQGEVNDLDLASWGFTQFYGNLEPQIRNWGRRSANASVIGGAASSWAPTNEFNFGKDQIYDLMAVANLLWSKQWPSMEDLTAIVQAAMPEVRERLSGRRAFSALGDPQVAAKLPMPAGSPTPSLSQVRVGEKRFKFHAAAAPLRIVAGTSTPPIALDADASSLIFLHTAEKAGTNHLAYRIIHAPEETADLLGHYEVLYADGFVATIPIRYGVHSLDRGWTAAARPRSTCYLADPVTVGEETYFAYEWRNPRLGKTIKTVSFKAVSDFIGARDVVVEANPFLVKAVTVVHPRTVGKPAPAVNAYDLDN